MQTEVFWNNIYATHQPHIPNGDEAVLSTAFKYFGDVSGARLLDLGCGDGSTSLYFAKKGAHVVAVDISEVAVNRLSQFCVENQISNITPIKCSAFVILDIAPFDFVFGNMILHHLEPFEDFYKILRKSIILGGKAFFQENNAFSNLLIWFRNNVIGKYGIPKYGDDDEFPLMPKEIESLSRYFSVKIDYPELLFFRLASTYLLKGRLGRLMTDLDNYFFQFDGFKKYSYRQYLFLS